MRLAESDK